MRHRDGRAGFTLVELTIVAVLGAIIVAALLQTLVTSQRTYSAEEVRIRNQQSLRMALEVLSSEVREISASGADIEAMEPSSMTVRVMRQFGILCDYDSTSSPLTLTVRKTGRWFSADDSVLVFADADQRIASDDGWLTGRISSTDTTATCPSTMDVAQVLRVSGLGAGASGNKVTDVRTGAPVRAFRRYTYGLYEFTGGWYLGRKKGSDAAVRIVGPLLSPGDSGLVFTYHDSTGAVTADSSKVARVELALRVRSEMRDARGNPLADSLRTRIYIRN